MKAYKLLAVKRDGVGPLFINRSQRIRPGEWLEAHCYPTKGYAVRPGWHCCAEPKAPHLSPKGRRWYRVEIMDYEKIVRPKSQGGVWYLAKWMKLIEPV